MKLFVFYNIGDNYIDSVYKDEFINSCLDSNSFLSNERCNQIALIATKPKYYNKEEIVMIYNKNPILWDREQVQLFILFNRKGKKYQDIIILNKIMITLLHSKANIVDIIYNLDTDKLIDYIVQLLY